MSSMLPSGDALAKCQNLDTWHKANQYGHQDAMRQLTGRDSNAIAAMIGLSGRTVRSWRDLDHEHRGPAEVLELAIVAALRLGRPVDEALAPIAALAEAFGFRLVDASAKEATSSDARIAASDMTRAAGSAIHTVLEAVADGRIEQSELPGVMSTTEALLAEVDKLRAAAIRAAAASAERTESASSVPLRAIR